MQGDYQCFCGDQFETRDDLIQHNVQRHEMSEDESRRKVEDKYPTQGSGMMG